uniref:F-box domain-containing protein n=1 Tax=Setaria italica TaxID=4555 RepID=K3YD01_SETIT
MEAPGKRKRGNDAGDAAAGYSSGDDRDRLSALPDSLIHHIMSFMKARQVVQTCVLSTRWRHLWRSMTCLDVDKSEFETPGAKKYLDYEGWEKFEDFMDTLLSPGNVSIASLDTLRLQASYGIGEGRPASRWIRRGIKYPHGQLPAAGVHRGKVVSYNSWRLRRLHLSNIELCDLFAEHVRTSCQSLEDLELGSCSCKFHAIASGSLKNLALKYCTLYGLDEIATPTLKNLLIESGTGTNLKTMDRPLVITAPALASMFLGVTPHNFVGGLSLSEMTSLAKVSVHLSCKEIVDPFKILGSCVSSVITNLEVLGEGSTTFIQFNNLRTLVLSHCDLSDDFQILGHFLRNSPNLERLTLLYCKYSNDTKKKKGPSKSKNAEYTPCPNLVDVPCKNLKLTHIIYKEDDIRQLIELLLHISGNLPNNYIKLTKA